MKGGKNKLKRRKKRRLGRWRSEKNEICGVEREGVVAGPSKIAFREFYHKI